MSLERKHFTGSRPAQDACARRQRSHATELRANKREREKTKILTKCNYGILGPNSNCSIWCGFIVDCSYNKSKRVEFGLQLELKLSLVVCWCTGHYVRQWPSSKKLTSSVNSFSLTLLLIVTKWVYKSVKHHTGLGLVRPVWPWTTLKCNHLTPLGLKGLKLGFSVFRKFYISGNFSEISGSIGKSLEVITCIIFIQIADIPGSHAKTSYFYGHNAYS